MDTVILKDNHNEHIHRVMPKGFAVLSYRCYNEELPDYHSMFFELFFGEGAKGNKVISEQQATAFIEEHNLTLAIDNEYGKVWE